MTAGSARLLTAITDSFGVGRLRTIPYVPVQRTFYPNVVFPRGAERQTVFEVRDASELVTVLKLANQLREAVHVRQGTGAVNIDLLNPFPPGALIVDLKRLRDFRVNAAAGYVEVGPAITLAESNALLDPYGFRFPVAVEPVTWGGLASVNLSGHLVDVVSGKPGDYVHGLEVVLPTGELITTGTRAMRKVVGPDLTRLFIGNQGLLGVITNLRLRLVAKPGGQSFGWAVFSNLESLAQTVQQMYRRRAPVPIVLEMVEASFVRVSGLAEFVPGGQLLMLTTDGSRPEEATWKLDTFLELAQEHGAKTARIDEAGWRKLWKIRMSPHLYMVGEYLVGEVIDAPIDQLEVAVATVDALRTEVSSAWPGIEAYLWGHIGSGTIHPAYSCPAAWSYSRRIEAARWLRNRILQIRVQIRGSVGEQGIFPQHADWFSAEYGATSLDLIRRLKAVFDPHGILNPGRMDPLWAEVGP